MTSINKVFLMGNLTHDPELKFTPQGTAFARLSLAVNRSVKGSDGEIKKYTDFFNTVVWGKQGENCAKYLTKGRPVHVEGRLQTRSYETADKQKRSVTEIIGISIQFLSGGNRTGEFSRNRTEPESAQPETAVEEQAADSEMVPF
jgi:single-strand DNA-binding protein